MDIPDFFTNKEKLLSYDFSLINNYLNTEIDHTYHIKNLSLEKELLVDYFKSILLGYNHVFIHKILEKR